MRGYRTRVKYSIAFISLFCILFIPKAKSHGDGLTMGGFQWGGDIELGYRFTDIDGRNRYKEVANLMGGLKLFDLSLWANDLEKKGFSDYFSLNLNGIGDPFPSGRFQIKKDKNYDLVATYKEYKYFFDREDTPLTDNHEFNTRLKRGTLGLTFFPKTDFRLNLGYSSTWREGDAGVPRYIGGLYSRFEQDLDEQLNEYFISGDFSIGTWDFHVKQSFWNFQNKSEIFSLPLIEDQSGHVKTYVSTIKAHTQFGDRWDLDTGYIYAHSEGRSEITTNHLGVDSGRGEFNFNTHVVELGLSYLLRKNWILHFDYRFHTLDQDGRSNTDVLLSSPADTPTDYNLSAHTGTFQVEYLPRENLSFRAGYRVQYRDINGENFVADPFDGGRHPNNDSISTHGWVASADWKPYKFLNFYGEYQGAHFSDPYTWISPANQNIAKVRVKYDTPIPNLNLKGSFLWKRKVNPDQDFRLDSQDYTIAAGYQPVYIPGFSLEALVTYERILDKKDLFNITPGFFTTGVFDSSALIYSGGASYEIYKGLGARVYGSYAKTWKENSQRYADGVISIWYKNKWVTPILTLERSYLIDHEVRNDSFDANLLTFSLRKDF